MAVTNLNMQILSSYLLGFGILGTVTLIVTTGLIMRHFSNSSIQSYNWRLRNWRLKQLSAIACLFFLAMAASCWVIQDAWGWIYLLVSFKTGGWWFAYVIKRV